MRNRTTRVAEISLPAISGNVRRVREVTGVDAVVVVKADGYGHGALLAAEAALAGGAAMLGTVDIAEALELREGGIEAPILCWMHEPGADFGAAVAADIEVGVSTEAQLEALAVAAGRRGRPATAQIKVDTGLSRNGAAPETWDALFARAAEFQRDGLVRMRGIFSHLANAGDDHDRIQARRFDDAVARLRATGIEPEMIHIAASAAVFSSLPLNYTAVRIGLAAYGLSPFDDRTSADLGLTPAMTLRSEIVGLRDVAAGTGVSYGFAHVCETATTLALVPLGYADGVPRGLSGTGTCVSIGGEACPIVGRVAMDQLVVDVGALVAGGARPSLGDPVVLFGDPERGHPPVEGWADTMRTINYEILTGIGRRVVRVPVPGCDA